MLKIGNALHSISIKQITDVPRYYLEERISKISAKAFALLSSPFVLIRDFFKGYFGPKKMAEAFSVKHEVTKSPELSPKSKSQKKSGSNPIVKAVVDAVLAEVSKATSSETAALAGKLMSLLTLNSANWDDETRTGKLGVTLGADIKGNVSIVLPHEAAEQTVQEGASLNPSIYDALVGAKVDPTLLNAILLNLPASVATVQWDGLNNNLIVILDLPNAVKMKVDLTIPPAQAKKLFPEFLEKFLPAKAQEIVPMIAPLLSQSMTLIWDGKSSQVKLFFTAPQTLDINEVLIKKTGFLQKLVKGMTKNVKVELPQNAAISVNLKTLEMKFENATFKLKKGIISKKVTLDTIAVNPEKKSLDVGINCLGSHKIHVDLTKSDIDKVDFGTHPTAVK